MLSMTTKKPVRDFISRIMLKHKENAKEKEKKVPAESGWDQLKDKRVMLRLKTQQNYGSLAHAVPVFITSRRFVISEPFTLMLPVCR